MTSIKPLNPSHPEDDAAKLLARLSRDGALYFPALLPAASIVNLRDELAHLLSSHGWLVEDQAQGNLIPRIPARHGAPGWWRMYQAMQSLEQFHKLAHDSALIEVIQKLLGPKIMNHPRRQVNMVSPGFWIPPYQEHMIVQGTVDVLTAWFPLLNGIGTHVLAQNTQRRLLPVSRNQQNGVGVALEQDAAIWLTPSGGFHCGDVLLIHALAIRTMPRHDGPDLQLSIDYRFQRAYEPVARGSLMPHHFPRVPGWPELTRRWSTRKWIRTPLVKQVVDFIMPSEIEGWHSALPYQVSTLVNSVDSKTLHPER